MPKKEVAKPAQPAKTDPVLPKSEKDTQRRDRALLATYASEQEIDAARDRSLAPLLQGTKAIEAKLDKGSQRLSELKKQAEALAAQKKPLPAPLLEDVEAAQKETSGLDADLAQRKALMESIRARYEADKQRFRELKGKGQ